MIIVQATVIKLDVIAMIETNATNVKVTKKVVTSTDIDLVLDQGPDLHRGTHMEAKEKTETKTAGSKTSDRTMMTTWTTGTRLTGLTRKPKKGASEEMLGKR